MRSVVRSVGSVIGFMFVLAVGVAAVGMALGYRLSPVLSGSMRPTYASGDAVITRSVPVSSIRPGMIVEFVPPGETSPFAHRVLTVSGSPSNPVVTTKGDANPVPDAWHIRLSHPVAQEVVGVVPLVGRLMVGERRLGNGSFALCGIGFIVTGAGLAMLVSALRRETRPLHRDPQPYPVSC